MPLFCVFSVITMWGGESSRGGLADIANIAETADMACGLGGEKKRRLRTDGVRSLGSLYYVLIGL